MGFEDVSVSFSLDSIAASVRCGGERVMTMREIGPPGSMPGVLPNWSSLQGPWGPGLRCEMSRPGLRMIRFHRASVFQRDDCGSCRCGKRRLCVSQRRRHTGNDCSGNRRRDRPVVATVDVAPSPQSIWCGGIAARTWTYEPGAFSIAASFPLPGWRAETCPPP